MAGQRPRQLGRAGLQGRVVGQHLGQETDGARLFRAHQPRGVHQVDHPGRADQRRQPGVVGHGKAVAERLGDGETDARVRGADAARGRRDPLRRGHRGDGGAPAGAGAGDGGDRGLGAFLDGGQHAVHPRLVGEGVLGGAEVPELRDVGPGGEGAVAGAGHHQGAHAVVRGDLAAEGGEPLVHGEGEGVPRLRPVQRGEADAVADLVQQLFHACLLPVPRQRRGGRGRGNPFAPA